MNPRTHVLMALCCMLGAAGCSSQQHRGAPAALAQREPHAPYSIAQVGFSDAAYFGVCLRPACPSVTAKHIAPVDMRAAGDRADAVPTASDIRETARERHSEEVNVLTLYFTTGQSRLDTAARRAIDALVDSTPARRLRIAAHTDATGTPAENSRVARARAAAVMRYLHTMPKLLGVPIDAQAKALCCYVADNDHEAGRRLNRRVDVELIAADQQRAP